MPKESEEKEARWKEKKKYTTDKIYDCKSSTFRTYQISDDQHLFGSTNVIIYGFAQRDTNLPQF